MINQITIIHPSRNRSNKCIETAKRWIEQSSKKFKIRYILSVDSDDCQLPIYNSITELNRNGEDKIFDILIGNNRTAIQAINSAAKYCENDNVNDLIIVVSDDFDCFIDWDIYLMSNLSDREDFIVKTSDGIQDWLITLPIMDRKYYKRFGYVYYPEYLHLFCDTEMTSVADILGRKIDLTSTQFVFKHIHYITGLCQKDEINEKNDLTWAQGEELYNSRKAKNFYL